MRTHRLALATTMACFCLLLVGGLVHATGSGLACGTDWPWCRGQAFPPMEGGVLYEHGHRLSALAVILLTTTLMGALLSRRGLRALGVGALLLVLVQALLGALTVRLGLPISFKTVHLAVSMAFFATLVLITVRTQVPAHAHPLARGVRLLIGATAVVVYGQIVLGAFVKHTGSSLACLDVPLCGGKLWPDFGPAELQMVHRFGAVVALALIAVVAARTRRHTGGFVRLLAVAPVGLVILQIGLGMVAVWTHLAIPIAVAHIGVGAALLADLLALYLVTEAPA